jgi:dihydrofolate reductase
MNKITVIAAIGKNRELGYNNDLIWKIPEDLNFFKDNTMGKYIVMGMNTFVSLPKLLPGRKHIVLTSKNVDLGDDVIIIHGIDELVQYIDNLGSEVMIIGGASIYRQMIKYTDRMLLTEIDSESMADVYFPEFFMEEWNRKLISSHNYNDIEYSHVEYTRKRVK